MTEDELTALAAKTGKTLVWAGFLLGMMLLVLLIDLQLKRSIARTAIIAAGRHDSIMRMTDGIMADLTRKGTPSGRPVMAESDSPSRGPGSDGMDGAPPVAASASDPGSEAAGVPAAAPASPRKRTPGNGRRAGRTAEGS